MSPEQKRAITAVVISGLILFGWQYFFAPPVVQTATVTKTEIKNVSLNDQSKPETPSSVSDAVVVESQSIEINNEKITYTIDSNLTVKEVTSEQTHEKLTDLFKLQKNNKVLFNFDGSFKSMVSFFVKKNDMDISELETVLKEINKKKD